MSRLHSTVRQLDFGMNQECHSMENSIASYEALDEALESIAFAGPELENEQTNHAPMAIEAFCAVGPRRSGASMARPISYRNDYMARTAWSPLGRGWRCIAWQ